MSLKKWNEKHKTIGDVFDDLARGIKPTPPSVKPEPSQSKKLTWDENGIRDENGNPVTSFEELAGCIFMDKDGIGRIGVTGISSKGYLETPKPDMVNHPSHYTRGKVETIDGLESAVEGLQGKEAGLTWQVIRYMWRWKFKNNPLEDLKKAEFYLKRLIKHVEEEPNE